MNDKGKAFLLAVLCVLLLMPVAWGEEPALRAEWGEIPQIGNPVTQVALTALSPITDVELLSLLWENGAPTVDEATSLGDLDAQETVRVTVEFIGDLPGSGIQYTDEAGKTHTYSLDISGEDGSLHLGALEGLISVAGSQWRRVLPGTWTLEAFMNGEDGQYLSESYLTLEEDGRMRLRCHGLDWEHEGTWEGTWSIALGAQGMDRLTLVFPSADAPNQQLIAPPVQCSYNVYWESWVESDTLYTHLMLSEEEGSGVSPFVTLYGEDEGANMTLYREQGPNMRVIRCKEYVSLRQEMSTSSKRLKKVPLGALVLALSEEENGFTRCVFQDTYGYILSEYLQPME